MIVLETPRLTLRRLSTDDAPFIVKLLNDPGWLRFIGDRGVRTLDDARAYLLKGPIAMYERCGFGLLLVERKSDGAPLGMCGLIRRDGLDDVDIGFALMPEFNGQGYAHEAALATMTYGRETIALERIVGITAQDNERSIKLLKKIGLSFEKLVRMPNAEEEIMLFGWNAKPAE